jgi:hypothetical protein
VKAGVLPPIGDDAKSEKNRKTYAAGLAQAYGYGELDADARPADQPEGRILTDEEMGIEPEAPPVEATPELGPEDMAFVDEIQDLIRKGEEDERQGDEVGQEQLQEREQAQVDEAGVQREEQQGQQAGPLTEDQQVSVDSSSQAVTTNPADVTINDFVRVYGQREDQILAQGRVVKKLKNAVDVETAEGERRLFYKDIGQVYFERDQLNQVRQLSPLSARRRRISRQRP